MIEGSVIALTGASGFIGRHIARHLVDAGWRVRVLVRPGSEGRLPNVPLEICSGALGDRSALRRLVQGSEGVVHCAGKVRGYAPADFEPVNTHATADLAGLAQDAGVRRFILISSLAAREPRLSPYAASKRKAEDRLAEVADRMAWVALRPPGVYGPGDREMRPLLVAMARGLMPIVGHPRGRFSLLYVEDLARAVVAALQASVTGEILEIGDGKPGGYGWDEILAIAEAYRGGRVVPLPVPEFLLRGVARLSLPVARLMGRVPMLTPFKVNELRHPDWVCDNSRIVRFLDWRPAVDFARGLRLTLTTGRDHENLSRSPE